MFDKRLIEERWKHESKSRREGREEKKERERSCKKEINRALNLGLYCSVNMYDRNHTKYSAAFRLISQDPTDWYLSFTINVTSFARS